MCKKRQIIEKEILLDKSFEYMRSPIIEPILSYLNMKTVGALLLTGDWGCGKTYHIKNYIFPKIEKDTKFIPIIVSLYGETDKNNIAQKVLFAYFDNKGKNVNLGTGTIAKNVKNLSEAIPYIKKFVDVEKLLLGTGENVFKLIPHDQLLICFDDIERMSDKISPDDFLGIINELVENKGCKVLLIANEDKINGGITYKEKTIERTIHFVPNLSEIFDSVIADYIDLFKSYLINNKDWFIQTLTANAEEKDVNAELKKSFANIRTLKFALEHFRIVFELLVKENIPDELGVQLKNLWIFILSISIEFRKNNIDFYNKKNLDKQTSIIHDLILHNLNFGDPLQDKANTTNEDDEGIFSKNFIVKYYKRLSEIYIYHEDLYDLITSGKQIDKEKFRKNVEDSFKVKGGKINPAHQILNSFLRQGFWKYTDEKFVQTLSKLLEYCEKGILEDAVSYLNSSVYLLKFNEIINSEKSEITEKIKKGIDSFFSRVDFDHFAKSQFEVVQGEFTGDSHLTLLVEYIKQKIKGSETSKVSKEVKKIQSLFETALSDFVKEFLPEKYDSIRTPDKPLLHKLETEIIKKGIKNSNPEGIMDLASLLKFRYIDTSFNKNLIEEMKFLDEVEAGVSDIDLTKKTLSNYLIETELIPKITESRKRLQEHIDE